MDILKTVVRIFLLLMFLCWALHSSAQSFDNQARIEANQTTSGGSLGHYAEIQKAAALYAAKNFNDAATVYSRLTREDPQNGDLWIREGKSYQNAGDSRKAIAAYLRGTELGFGSSYVSINIARLYAIQQDDMHALEWIERALRERLDGRTALLDDESFARLKSNPRFRRLVAALPKEHVGRVEGWRFDIDLLVEEAQRLHASPKREAFSAEFTNAAKQLRKAIGSTNDSELELGIQRLVVMLGDGHSNALSSKPSKMMQVDLYQFSDGVFVLNGDGPVKNVVGAKVLRIGGKPIDWLLEQIRAYQPHDNSMMYRWTLPTYLTDPDLLKHFGALTNENEATMTVQDNTGRVSDLRVPITSNWQQSKLFPSLISSTPAPLYLSKVAENFWYTSVPKYSALYLQINQLWRKPDTTIEQLAEQVSAELVSTKSRTLIIDVRHDNGGNGYLSRSLIRAIAAFEQSNKTNRVFVIVGRDTFSAGQIFITLVERFTNAVFVGEPSSSRPNFTGEDGERLVLPFSKMKINISYKYHQNSAFDDTRQWIPVAVPIELDSHSYFRNDDPILSAVFDLISDTR